jgi:hypothetical protein
LVNGISRLIKSNMGSAEASFGNVLRLQ